jgi:hypothetical protein
VRARARAPTNLCGANVQPHQQLSLADRLKHGHSFKQFTQHDINEMNVMYLDDVGEERRDEYLKLRVVAGNLQVQQ